MNIDAKLQKWFLELLSLRGIKETKDLKIPKPYKFPELLELFPNESVLPEHILLLFYKRGWILISDHHINRINDAKILGQSYSFNDIMFVLDLENTKNFLEELNKSV